MEGRRWPRLHRNILPMVAATDKGVVTLRNDSQIRADRKRSAHTHVWAEQSSVLNEALEEAQQINRIRPGDGRGRVERECRWRCHIPGQPRLYGQNSECKRPQPEDN